MIDRLGWILVVAALIGQVLIGECRAAFADETKPIDSAKSNGSFLPLRSELESLVHKFYPKVKVKVSDTSMHFEYKTRSYDIISTNTIEPGPDWGGILGDVSISSGRLKDEDAVERKLNQYSFYYVMEMHTNCQSSDAHVDARLAYPFDVQPEFLATFKKLMREKASAL